MNTKAKAASGLLKIAACSPTRAALAAALLALSASPLAGCKGIPAATPGRDWARRAARYAGEEATSAVG